MSHVPLNESDDRRTIAELIEAVRARDEFIAIAAHELRNPMTSILFQVEKLLATIRRLPESGEVASDAERLERLINAYIRRAATLLNVSRITAGKLHLEREEVDLSGLVGRIAADLAPAAEWAGSPLRLFVAGGVIGTLDHLKVEQIVDNLLSNAIKFGDGKPIDVSLADDGAIAWLRVRDSGIGIARDAQARIFERFEQAVGQSRKGGFGIGLWLSRCLTEAMGGELSVTSRPGKGSTFTVWLPLRSSEEEKR